MAVIRPIQCGINQQQSFGQQHTRTEVAHRVATESRRLQHLSAQQELHHFSSWVSFIFCFHLNSIRHQILYGQ